MYRIGVPVPYPVQIVGTEVLEEFIGDHETQEAAPRLAAVRADDAPNSGDLWDQLVAATSLMARAGFAHGDLSAYNILVHEGRLVLIDLPQIVDVVANPQGRDFLIRDAENVATWFRSRGLDVDGDDSRSRADRRGEYPMNEQRAPESPGARFHTGDQLSSILRRTYCRMPPCR